MKRTKVDIYLSQETHNILMELWFKTRRQDRKSTISDIVEQAIKEYASKDANNK